MVLISHKIANVLFPLRSGCLHVPFSENTVQRLSTVLTARINLDIGGLYRSHAITNILGTKSNMNEYIMTIAFQRTYKRSLCDCYKTCKKYENLLESITKSREIVGLAINMYAERLHLNKTLCNYSNYVIM